ncbi:MAG TPA: BON domain-containing protein [Terriglobia bacterium]|nr:BON domain-containing protein [Terriglobia bacterium]
MRKLGLYSLIVLLALAAQTGFAATRNSDAKTTAAIQSRIYHAKVFNHGQVQVAFDQGVATLTGTVDNLGSKLDAEKAASKVPGVVSVVNHITVKADDFSAQQMLEQARKKIVTYYAYGIFDNINLEARGNKLIVSGQVSEPFKRTDIGNFLPRVKGVAEVENNLEVLPLSTYDDSIRLAVARAIYGDPYFVYYTDQAVPPIHIIVKNGNVTLEGVVNSKLDRAKADAVARSAGLSLSFTNNLRVERS